MPNAPDSHVAIDGISRELVQVQTITAPISAGPTLACAIADRAARNERFSRVSDV